MWNDQILLHVQQAVAGHQANLRKLGHDLLLDQLKEPADCRSFLDADGPPMARPIPVRVSHLEHFLCFPRKQRRRLSRPAIVAT